VNYLAEARVALGTLPTQKRLVLERFFDESGGMQLVLHAPFGSRVNKAWGLALRKRFCRQFNFELQAAATEDAILLSLGPQHSFPLADVFRYLHPATTRDVLVQAFLDAPVFQTRWRWNTTISLAIPRNRGGRKVAPPLQRAMADDLMAAVFPDGAACLENIGGDRKLPDHPLVNQAVRDCLEEAMDYEQLAKILGSIHAGEIECIARDTIEPSPLSHEILNAKPYAFLDDAPLEERRTQAVLTRRASDPSNARDLGALDSAAIERVREEVRPDPRDADELHDALLTAGFLNDDDASRLPRELFEQLAASRRAARVTTNDPAVAMWIAAERLPELQAIHSELHLAPSLTVPASRRQRSWTRGEAIAELIRGRLSITGPTTAGELAVSLGIANVESESALVLLESEGVVLRGTFTPAVLRLRSNETEWCDRRLLARIHRLTLNRLRAEIEPVNSADFMRFLFAWQHVSATARLSGIDGLREAITLLDGYEVAADSWERSILTARLERYESSMLDLLCLSGEVGWGRLSAPATSVSADGAALARIVGASPIALYRRENAAAWLALRSTERETLNGAPVGEIAMQVAEALRARGASFAGELAASCGLTETETLKALAELVSAGLVSSDGFAGLRSLIRPASQRPRGRDTAANFAGRWSFLQTDFDEESRERAVETQARALLKRYGVVFRKLLTREPNAAPWRELLRVYRRLEARGEIRGGRFVHGMSGEQYALPEAVQQLREVRRQSPDGKLVLLSAADPLNLTGILDTNERVRAVAANRIAWRDGIAVSVLEGDYLRALATVEQEVAMEAATALAGRRVPVSTGYVGRA
jgi:ATP-dependent Lhr-like helicase